MTYFLTERGEKLLRAVRIMQDIGVEYMLENGQADILEHKGIIPCRRGHTHKKVTTVLSATCRYRGHNTRRYGMNTALLLIDIQNDYFPGGAWELSHADEAAAQARLALERFRNNTGPFSTSGISTPVLARPSSCRIRPVPEIHGAVKPLDGEPVIIKHAPDAFSKRISTTPSAPGGHTETSSSAGMMSHMCIDTSVRAARSHGYDITLLHDACATRDLSWNGKTIPAATVHEAFMAALHGAFADVRTTGDFLPSLPA